MALHRLEVCVAWGSLPLMLVMTALAAADVHREDCSPMLCGNVTISFPFGILPKQATETRCGNIEVQCSNNTPYLGFEEHERLFQIQILDIFYDNSSLVVADVHKLQDLKLYGSKNCHSPSVNSSTKLGFPFSISPVNQNLIFYNCTKRPAPSAGKGLVETRCGNSTFVRVAERYDESGSNGSYSLEGCNATFVPVLVWSGRTNASKYEELIRDGFLLTWQQGKFTREYIENSRIANRQNQQPCMPRF